MSHYKRTADLSLNEVHHSAPPDAFPGVLRITVRGMQRATTAQLATEVMTEWTPKYPQAYRPFLTCGNDFCVGGGFDIRTQLQEMLGKRETSRRVPVIQCLGHEGSERKRTCRACRNAVDNVEFEIEYEEPAAPAST